MDTCGTCGNQYDKSMRITVAGATHTFDCFECAIQKLAPTCEHCKCRIIGHGVEVAGAFFCGAHCANALVGAGLQDRR